LDLRALWPTAPKTELDADSTLSVFQSGNDWVANVTGTTRATTVSDISVPPIDVTGMYDVKGFSGHATVHEPGMPIQASFDVHPDGSIDGTAEAKRVDLARAPRLQPYFDGRGLLDVQLKARIEKNRLVAQVNGTLDSFEYGQLSINSNRFTGRATGPVNAPERLSLDVSLASKRLRAGAFGFDELETKLRGPVTHPVVSTTITNHQGPVITAQATVTPRKQPRIDDLSVEVRRDEDALTAKVARVDIDGSQVRVSGLSMQGAGGKLEGSGQLGPQRVAVVAHGSGLDLAIIAHTLGLPRGLVGGKLALDADVESTGKTQRGTFDLKLEQGQSEGIAVDSLALSGQLSGAQLNLQSTAKLRDFGAFSGEARTTLAGSLADPRSFEHATGIVTIKAEHVPLGLLGYAFPKSVGVTEVRGEASATLVLDRSDPTAIPNASLVANTNGLYVGLAPRSPGAAGTAIDGVDAHAGLNINGITGETDATLKLEDRYGPLVSATTRLTVDLATAIRHPNLLLAQLRSTPLVAKAVVEDRSLEELPALIVIKGIAGRLRTEVSLRGSVDHPIFSDKTELSSLRFGASERDRAIDVCAQLDYDKSSGQYGARGELFLPEKTAHACSGSRVAQFSAGGRAEWNKLLNPTLSADPAWTGTAGLSLEGMPLDIVPALAEAGFDGRVLGVVMFDRRDALPEIRSQLEVRDAVVARTRLGTARIQAHTDGRSLKASVDVEQRDGKLSADVQSSVDWQGVVPGIDDTRPISARRPATWMPSSSRLSCRTCCPKSAESWTPI
jgi:hypothetical protein